MTALPENVVTDLYRLVAELEQRLESSFAAHDEAIAQRDAAAAENARLQNELNNSRDRQDASAEILRTIAAAPTDAKQALQRIVETTARFFGASSVRIRLAQDGEWIGTFSVGRSSESVSAAVPAAAARIGGRNLPGTVVAENRQIHIPDLDDLDPDMADWPGLPPARAAGARVMCGTPLRRGGKAIGVLILHRDQPVPFTDDELALQQSFADQAVIAIENARLFNQTQETLARQTATADILRVISQSPTDVQPVFYAIVRTAVQLLGCDMVALLRRDGATFSPAAAASPEGHVPNTTAAKVPIDPEANFPSRVIVERKMLHLPDYSRIELPEHERRIQAITGINSALFLPLLREDECIGVLALTGKQPRTFSENEIALAQSFRDQAQIAIENTRLFNETKQALERQTATADILKVIASSPDDVQPVFEAIAASANRLIGGFSTTVFRFIDGTMHLKAFTPTNPQADEFLQASFPRPLDEFPVFELVGNGETTQFADTEAESGVPLMIRDLARLRGYRSMLFTPLMSNRETIGMIGLTRPEPGAFASHHVQLLQTFADQAVIAIENVRLFDEVQARTRDLTESLQQQTATADVLKVISRSAFDLDTVMNTLAQSAAELCAADLSGLFLRDGEHLALRGFADLGSLDKKLVDDLKELRVPIDRGSHMGRAVLDGTMANVPDTDKDTSTNVLTFQHALGFKAMLIFPLMREGRGVGVFGLCRNRIGAFTHRQIELVQTFADQAVIAIENVRLFEEVQAKTRDLTEALTYQTGSSNILKVIASSPTDVEPVLKAIVESACELCDAKDAVVHLRDGDEVRLGAHHGPLPLGFERRPISRDFVVGRVITDKAPIHLSDILSADGDDFPEGQQMSRDRGTRTILSVPLLREDACIGAILLRRSEVNPFSDKQFALLRTFADQAVIALSNVRLFEEVQQRTRELSKSLDNLRTAQDRLVQTEKLASLGQLTAGIAHEIKNPLNFVNNFAALSAELTGELNDALRPAALDDNIRQEVNELTGLLKDNLEKVVQHGKRADSIVKNMLLHSREGSGEHRPTDINALVDESLNLAYYGARAEKPQFNVTLQRDFDLNAGTIEVFPQEITRVFLNLISNGFYAVSKRKTEQADATFEPSLSAATRDLGDGVEIRIRDNGTGIPPEIKDKMFNPFFTTKPAGEGTGLGLSMSHDIIVKQHGGTIDVATAPGQFTEFIIVLPRTSNSSNKPRG